MLPFNMNILRDSGAHASSFSVRKWALFSRGKADGGVKLTTYVHLVLRLGMTGGVLRLPHMPPWLHQSDLPFFFFYNIHSSPKFSEYVLWLKYKRKLIHIGSSVLSFQRLVCCTYIETYL